MAKKKKTAAPKAPAPPAVQDNVAPSKPTSLKYERIVGGLDISLAVVNNPGIYRLGARAADDYLQKIPDYTMNRHEVALVCGEIEVLFKKHGALVVEPCAVVRQ